MQIAMLDITCRLYQELRINAVDITCKNTSAPVVIETLIVG